MFLLYIMSIKSINSFDDLDESKLNNKVKVTYKKVDDSGNDLKLEKGYISQILNKGEGERKKTILYVMV